MNASRQWLLPRSKIIEHVRTKFQNTLSPEQVEKAADEYKATAMVASIHFFDTYYLHPDPEAGFDSMFYDEEPLPTPIFHYDFYRAIANEAAVIEIAPRGSAKSVKERKISLVRLITRPNYKLLYCTSSEKVATETAQAVRQQCYTNQRIFDDWTPLYGGRLKPLRGDAPTGIEEFALSNGSTFATYSVNSKMRGKRPRRFVLDDPEYDPSASTSMAVIREYMKRLLLKIALPMVMRRECGIEWLATFVSKRHFAYQAMMVKEIMEEGKVVLRSDIAEFNYWHRILVRAAEENTETGKLVSCWPHQWPVDEAQKKELGLSKDTRTLEEIRLRIGTQNFNSEYMAKPGDTDEGFFSYDDDRHGYTLEGADPLLEINPRVSLTKISWKKHLPGKDPARVEMTLFDFFKEARTFITCDTSRTATSSSDYKVSTLMAITPDNELFVLDQFGERCSSLRHEEMTLKMADKWKCARIAPEEIEDGINLSRNLKNLLATRAHELMGVSFLPQIKGFNPGKTDKTTKISSILYRFDHNLLKLPIQYRNEKKWRLLFEQIEGFNPDAEGGGLQNDDHLDTVAMSQYVISGRLAKPLGQSGVDQEDALARLLAGETHDENGTPMAYHLNLATLPAESVHKIMAKARERAKPSEQSKV